MSNTVEDQLALQDLMARYVDAVSRRNAQDWAATWDENGCWNLLGNEVNGRDNIVGLWQQMMAGFEFALMIPSSCLFHIDGDSASGHYYLQEIARDKDGNSSTIFSRYIDTYSRRDGQWLYQSRRYEIIYHGADVLNGSYTPPQ